MLFFAIFMLVCEAQLLYTNVNGQQISLHNNSDDVIATLTGTPYPQSLIFLGTSSDGKNFLVDRQTKRSWQESRQFCKDYNLLLASITSPSQTDFLIQTKDESESIQYWTSARENRESPSAFIWEGTRTHPQPNNFGGWYYVVESESHPYEACGLFFANDGKILAERCRLGYSALCQTP